MYLKINIDTEDYVLFEGPLRGKLTERRRKKLFDNIFDLLDKTMQHLDAFPEDDAQSKGDIVFKGRTIGSWKMVLEADFKEKNVIYGSFRSDQQAATGE